MNLLEALARSSDLLNAQTELFFDQYEKDLDSVDPVSVALARRLREYSLQPGKAARPLLVAVGAALSQGVSLEEAFAQKKVQLAMLIIEMTHKRILMADDVADQDEQRHGVPTFHVQWDRDLASDQLHKRLAPEFRTHMARSYTEVAGIVYQNLTYFLLADDVFSAEERKNMLISLQKHTYDPTPAGWYLQFSQNFRSIADISQQELYRCYELITGEYTYVNPLQLGALLGPNTAQFTDFFVRFGYPSGVLFQITDDLIGVLGDSTVTGKPVGNDFREGKKSLLVQYAYKKGTPEQRAFLEEMIGNQGITHSQTAEVTEIIRATGAEEFSRQEAAKCADTAKAALSELQDGELKNLLIQITEYVLTRNK